MQTTTRDLIKINDQLARASRAADIATKISRVFQKRTEKATTHFAEQLQSTYQEHIGKLRSRPMSPAELWSALPAYTIDFWQRWILFWDTMRQRGNMSVEHERAGKPPVLHFKYEIVLDGRKLPRPVNYALIRIIPPEGIKTDPKRRPYMIIDPRAGHGPGIGGFKDDSQVGVALKDGHPVYFVIFFPEPEPGQTMLDVTVAEQKFVRKIRELHSDSPKPVLVGNCQGGWAAMMLAASDAEDTGAIVINGAPMSYWGGAWAEGEGDNPMRYAGGLLGGTWLASLTADLGNGVFDGAWLVQNMENLNPANTFWDKYYHVFANVDTEPPRFLEFERWWGGYYLMNTNEIEWITRNLFVGNKLWSGAVRSKDGNAFDLRDIKSPIILFASMGDNITPPQQAFNWVADVYGSTEEIKSRGQVIVGLLHRDIGHLGIFVSGRVAKREHKQIVSVLKSIEALPPGLYGMQIMEKKQDGKVEYDVQFLERTLEDVQGKLNRFKRADEKPFEAVEELSDFYQHAYELFGRPFVQAMSNEWQARLLRLMHPLRMQRWVISDLNPWLAWLEPVAKVVKAQRKPLGPEAPMRQLEFAFSDFISASLDFYRGYRDAMSEALFFTLYGNMFNLYLAKSTVQTEAETVVEHKDLPYVKQALASMSVGGYPEAMARTFALLAKHGEPIPLDQFHLKTELAEKYADFLPPIPRDQQRHIRGVQDIIVQYDPQGALNTMPKLLTNRADREKLRTFLDRLWAEERIQAMALTQQQRDMLDKIHRMLGEKTKAPPSNRKPQFRKHTRAMQPA